MITVHPMRDTGERYPKESGIGSCFINGCRIDYDVDTEFSFKTAHQETVEEARAIVEQQQKAAPTSTP
jgi:hypothetical protein